MPDTVPPMPAPQPEAELAALRAELDGIDDGLHDLLMRRAAVVERVGALRGKVPLRAGREAAILRRLVDAGTRIAQMGYAGEGDVDQVVDNLLASIPVPAVRA